MSTLANELLNLYEDAVIIAADDYFETRGGYDWDRSKIKLAHANCKDRTSNAIDFGIEVIVVHNTSTTQKEIDPYQVMAEENGYRFISLIVENRHEGVSIHDVPEDAINRMKERFTFKL